MKNRIESFSTESLLGRIERKGTGPGLFHTLPPRLLAITSSPPIREYHSRAHKMMMIPMYYIGSSGFVFFLFPSE